MLIQSSEHEEEAAIIKQPGSITHQNMELNQDTSEIEDTSDPTKMRICQILKDEVGDDVHGQGIFHDLVIHNHLIHDEVANNLTLNAAVVPYDWSLSPCPQAVK